MKSLTALLILMLTGIAHAGIGEWNFDNGRQDRYLDLQCGSGELTRGSAGFYEIDGPQGRPLEFGPWSVSPFNQAQSSVPYILNFDYEPPTGFSLDMGDLQTDVDTLSLKAYSGIHGTGTLLASTTVTLPGPEFYKRVSVQAAGIRSVVFIGGSASNPNSVFYDNFKTTCAPNGTIFSRIPDFLAFADKTVFRPSNGTWYSLYGHGFTPLFGAKQFGASGDKPIPGDFDGNRVSDVAVFRNGTWYVLLSESNTFQANQFGSVGDIPLSTDFDNDGKTDLAVFRPSSGIWYWIRSSDGQFNSVQFGTTGDMPLPGNYDRDGKADMTVYRPENGTWYVLRSSDQQFYGVNFGINTDRPVPADYDGDGLTDIAVYRNGFWYRLNSSNGQFVAHQFGLSSDIPVPADYSNCFQASLVDGKSDLAVWRASTGVWYHQLGDGRLCVRDWGTTGDIPISLVNY